MSFVISELPWLPTPPGDFKEKSKTLLNNANPGTILVQLANTRLSSAQTRNLSRKITQLRISGTDLAPLVEFKLGVLSSSTTELLTDLLPAAAARHGVSLEVTDTPYSQVVQQAIDPSSTINANKLDGVLIALDHYWLKLDSPQYGEDFDKRIGQAISTTENLIENIQNHSGATTIVQTLPVPPISIFGNSEKNIQGSIRSLIETYNTRLLSLASATRSPILDIASLASQVGTDRWFNPIQRHAYKLPFNGEYNLVYADALGRLLGAMRGKTKKCLVLDLDNTIWGGVIGDDGLAGIKLGQGSAAGEAFLEIQKTAIALKERGIILAVCSKNNDSTAREPFRSHPDMLLKESDIAVFQANWADKASNLEVIADTLNIGIDSLVLLDDNPAERAQVRSALPMVGVPELPNDPSWYPWLLCSGGYFESIGFSEDDKLRSQSYVSNAQRATVKAKSRSMEDYLDSLQMELNVSAFDNNNIPRITQLVNKTNQFNLTTQRYTENEIENFKNDASKYTLQARLKDSFGELGMIAVVIIHCSSQTWHIDSWLMSCRVLGRKVEEALLSVILRDAKKMGVKTLTGTYIPTKKNTMVSDHYTKLGFKLTSEDETGIRSFTACTDSIELGTLPIKIFEDGKYVNFKESNNTKAA